MIDANKNFAEPRRVDSAEQHFQALKSAIHQDLIESLDLSIIGTIEQDQLEPEVRAVANEFCRSRANNLSPDDRRRMVDDLMDEVFGMGPLERLMGDSSISDILVNGPQEVFIERNGQLEATDVIFSDDDHVLRVIQRVVSRVGRRIDEVNPMVDARLPDGSRINAVVPPLALRGPTLSIRRFGARPLAAQDLINNQSMRPEMVQFLAAAVEARLSFLISGGTGAGKTTLLNAMSAYIPASERLVTIEDSAELMLQHEHVIPLETRTSNTEGSGEVTMRELVRNSLRMRPDRILIGEVRGGESLDMLQAMNTGHEGSLTTIHANDAQDALSRLEMMVAMTGFELPTAVVRQYIAAGIRLVVHLSRLKGGVRRVMGVSEIVDVKDGEFVLEDIFGFKQTGLGTDGRACGHFYATGYVPACLQRMRAEGCQLPDEIFTARQF